MYDLATVKYRCAERIELIRLLWPKEDPSEMAGLFLDYALGVPWETQFKELPKEPDLLLQQYQRYYTAYLDALTIPSFLLDLRSYSRRLRQEKVLPTG